MTVTAVTTGVGRAGSADREVVSAVLAQAFSGDPVISWAFPDDARRREVLPGLFSIFVDEFLRSGEVWMARGGVGAALGMPPEPGLGAEEAEELVGRIRRLLGPAGERFDELMALMDEHHPHDPCYYLLAIGVPPAWQGKGVGSALMATVVERCDRDGMAAYLEATSERSRRLYERHGFAPTGRFAPTGSPPLWPMWRARSTR